MLISGFLGVLYGVMCYSYVQRASVYIQQPDEVTPAFVAIVLGAKVQADGQPSAVLRDRLLTAVDLYQQGTVEKILLSGDNGQQEYDEVNGMRVFMLEHGIPPEDLFLDHAGFDTYDSMVRARAVFGVTSAIIVTQRFHGPRAIFLARSQGIEAFGVAADRQQYRGAVQFQLREILASIKAWNDVVLHSSPAFLGDAVDITGDGRITWDEDADFLDENE